MSPNLVALLYLVAGVLFIQALRGLSSPDTSRRGNYLGMIGMTIAVLTTLGSHPPEGALAWGLVVGGIAHRRRHRRGDRAPGADDLDAGTGGGLPFAGRHGGGAGGGGRLLRAGGLRHRHAKAISIKQSLIEMSLGAAIGAITFTGSVIAFLKLQRPHERQADHAAGAARRSTSRWPWAWCSSSTTSISRRPRSTSG